MRLFLIPLLVCLVFPLMAEQWPRAKIDRAHRLVNQVMDTSVQRINSKYRLKCIATSPSMCGGPVRDILLMLTAVGPVPQADLRRLLIACIHEVLDSAQQIPDFVSVLLSPPFDVNKVGISIILSDEDNNELCDPDISAVSIRNGNISYAFSDPQGQIFPYKRRIRETYEEAIEAIRREGEELQSQHKG